MKKSKILIPVLSVAGLGAALTPVIMLTSCAKPTEIKLETYESTWGYNKEVDLTEGKQYLVKVSYEANKFSNTFFHFETWSNLSVIKDGSVTIKVDGTNKAFEKSTTYKVTDFDQTNNHSIEITFTAAKTGKYRPCVHG